MSLSLKEKNPDEALEEYLDSIYLQSHSDASKISYETGIKGSKNGFRKFLTTKYNCNEIQLAYRIESKELDVYQVLKNYVIFMDKNNVKPNGIKLWYNVSKGYLTHLGIEVFSEKCKQIIKLPKVRRYKKEALTKEIIIKLLHNLPPKLQASVLFAVSSGIRIGELTELTLDDIELNAEPVKVNIRAETTKTREERDIFISKEASEALKDYLTRFFNWKEDETNSQLKDVKIFGRTSKRVGRPNTTGRKSRGSDNLQSALAGHIKNIPELNKLAKNGRRAIHFHAFREYFYTQMSNVSGSNFAHALMGHRNYLDTYYALSEKQRIKLYQKAEPYLTVSDFSRIEKDLDKIQENQTDILEKYAEFERYLRIKDPSFLEFLKRKNTH